MLASPIRRAFGLALVILLLPTAVQAQPVSPSSITESLARVPIGTTWQNLAPDVRSDLEKRADIVLAQERRAWGFEGLRQKEGILLSTPTPAMAVNIDRILAIKFASVTPNEFRMARDVTNTELKQMLVRLYLAATDDRGYMLTDHPDFMGWNGLPVKELQLLDHEHVADMARWLSDTESRLRAIPAANLTPLENSLREKAYFTTRQGKHFDRPALASSGIPFYSALYAFPVLKRPFTDAAALLDAYNTILFTKFREVNVGTLDALMYDYESEYQREWLDSQGVPGDLAPEILKLGLLFLTRIREHPEARDRCTLFTPAQREATWDAFTAGQISNADGSESMASYAKTFQTLATQRMGTMHEIGRITLERMFPEGSADLTSAQKALVMMHVAKETRPARMLQTLTASLDEATGGTAASDRLRSSMAAQHMVGGNYAQGQTVREQDRLMIQDMWDKLRAFIKREYSGYRRDIHALIPEKPIIVSTGQNQFTVGGQVNLSLGTAWNLASFSSTMMHEIKHAIDQNFHAAIEGAAWEGAATSVERQVWPFFIEEAMSNQAALLPLARLKTEIDNVRFTATTDATLKIFMRESCRQDEPDSIAFAEGIVASYGYTDPEVLRLRSRRAHRSSQYLMYDYGLVMYSDLIDYLQTEVGSKQRVDAFLFQACKLDSPRKDKATAEDLRACIRERSG